MAGAIYLHRSLIDSFAFSNETTLKIWIWLLLRANWKKTYMDVETGRGASTVAVDRGQLIYGRHKAAMALDIPGTTIDRHLERLEKEGQIKIKKFPKYSLISINKYNDYQQVNEESGQTTGRQRADNGQTTGTSNKVNKENKENNIIYAFESERFRDKYSDWIKFRKEKKKSMSESTINQQQEFLKKFSEDIAIEIINKSIMQGWTGLFEPKENSGTPIKTYVSATNPEENKW